MLFMLFLMLLVLARGCVELFFMWEMLKRKCRRATPFGIV